MNFHQICQRDWRLRCSYVLARFM